eukprot:TRINITY_DN4992_c0_g1_i2.p1 TRINITY_DN4992_c0_g1~~TRINITY_DN4992_c0_g1_i2.p1  ORF type:complete len:589 (-),score=97.76 TRINITY_DN4992_c0_g1_i2:13-1779(-)
MRTIEYLIYIILITIPLISTKTQQSCVYIGECADHINPLTCFRLNGVSSEKNCTERGFTMGTCCVAGTCIRSSETVCLAGTEDPDRWIQGDYCQTCAEGLMSCCTPSGGCVDGLQEGECDAAGGKWFNGVPCEKGGCVATEMHGACCYSNHCYDLPESLCGGIWHEGESCRDVGCGLERGNESIPGIGRCCSTFGCISVTQASDCDGRGYFEEGLACDDTFPCYPQGACVIGNDQDGECLTPLLLDGCDLLGGTMFDGGECANFSYVACSFPNINICNYLVSSTCDFVGGIQIDEPCSEEVGACCGSSTCSTVKGTDCQINRGIFFPGTTCESDPCLSGSCCKFGFCVDQSAAECAFLEENRGDFFSVRYDTCPSSGLCTLDNTILIIGQNISIPEDVYVNAAEIEFCSSVIDIGREGKSMFQRSSISLNDTHASFGSLELTNGTILHMSFNSGMTVNELLIINSEIDVDLSQEDLDTLKENEHLVMELNEFSGDLSNIKGNVDGIESEHVGFRMENGKLIMVYSEGEGESEEVAEPSTSNENTNDTVIVVVVVFAVVAVIGTTLFLLLRLEVVQNFICNTSPLNKPV